MSEKENSKSVLQENKVYQFQNPAGKDRIIIELEKDFYEIEINVSE